MIWVVNLVLVDEIMEEINERIKLELFFAFFTVSTNNIPYLALA